jgi:hypothetical protein
VVSGLLTANWRVIRIPGDMNQVNNGAYWGLKYITLEPCARQFLSFGSGISLPSESADPRGSHSHARLPYRITHDCLKDALRER